MSDVRRALPVGEPATCDFCGVEGFITVLYTLPTDDENRRAGVAYACPDHVEVAESLLQRPQTSPERSEGEPVLDEEPGV